MRTLLLIFLLLWTMGGCCHTPEPARAHEAVPEVHPAAATDDKEVSGSGERPRWLRGPWKDANEFFQLALRAVHDHSFGERSWRGSAPTAVTKQRLDAIGAYDIVRSTADRPFPVVIADTDSIRREDLPEQYPDTLLLLYGNEELKAYLESRERPDEEVLMMYLGHYHTGWIPQTYIAVRLRWARLNDGELERRGDFYRLAGWVVGRTWGGKEVTRMQIETLIGY